jgi:hypothetical protein
MCEDFQSRHAMFAELQQRRRGLTTPQVPRLPLVGGEDSAAQFSDRQAHSAIKKQWAARKQPEARPTEKRWRAGPTGTEMDIARELSSRVQVCPDPEKTPLTH